MRHAIRADDQVSSLDGGHARFAFAHPTDYICRRYALELERDAELGAVGLDLAVGVQLQIQLYDLGDAQIAQRLAGAADRRRGGLFQDSLLVPISSMTL